jgi:outer membrane protein OmpA-like peptidoglycan-associated protein
MRDYSTAIPCVNYCYRPNGLTSAREETVIRTAPSLPTNVSLPMQVGRSFLQRRDVITGYGTHAIKLLDQSLLFLPTNVRRIGEAVEHVVKSFDPDNGLKPILEIQVLGHADQDYRNGRRDQANEDRISQARADDIWQAMKEHFVRRNFPIDRFTGSNTIQLIVQGVGARQPVDRSKPLSAANRRVQILLLSTQTVPI